MSRISSSNIVPQGKLEQDGSNLEMQKVQESMQDIEERVFEWQQKEFSKVKNEIFCGRNALHVVLLSEPLKYWFFIYLQREIDLYQNIANCTSQLEKDYHAKVTELL